MRPEVRKHLHEGRGACGLIARFSTGKAFEEEEYAADVMLQSAVERQFEIIGEALAQAVRRHPALEESITDLPRIVAFRNRLIHAYANISNELVWGVIETHLVRLETEGAELLDSAD